MYQLHVWDNLVGLSHTITTNMQKIIEKHINIIRHHYGCRINLQTITLNSQNILRKHKSIIAFLDTELSQRDKVSPCGRQGCKKPSHQQSWPWPISLDRHIAVATSEQSTERWKKLISKRTKCMLIMYTAEFIWYFPSISLFTLNVRGPSYLGLFRSISWLLMPWLLTSPGHQQPWYRLYKIWRFLSYLRKGFMCLCHIIVEEWHKM